MPWWGPSPQEPEPTTLEGRLKSLIEKFKKEASKHKRLHRGLHLAVLLLTMATTIVAGYGLSLGNQDQPPLRQSDIQLALIVLTATTTAVAGYAALRRAGDVWQIERTICHRLQDIDLEVTWLKSAGRWDADNQKLVLDRILVVLGTSSEEWRACIQTALPSAGERGGPSSRPDSPGARPGTGDG